MLSVNVTVLSPFPEHGWVVVHVLHELAYEDKHLLDFFLVFISSAEQPKTMALVFI